MFGFKTLDTVIAMIVVILVLSLIVQSVQSLIKKWFKLKSNSILTSLDDLFKYVDSKTLTGIDSSELVKGVAEQLKILGRISLRGAANDRFDCQRRFAEDPREDFSRKT
jgi:hypothetical protein